MMLMKTKKTLFSAAVSTALLTFAYLNPVTVMAAPGTLADSPLFLSNSVEPNILFMVDDSGSMDWGMMTAENNGIMHVGCDYRYAQPAPDHSGDRVPPTEKALSDAGVAAPYGGVWRAWNKDYNRLYYDPSVTYVPWPGENGNNVPYANVNPVAAVYNPYNPSEGTRNLTTTVTYDTDYCDVSDVTNIRCRFLPGTLLYLDRH